MACGARYAIFFRVEALDADGARRIEKPWGYEIWYAQTDQYAGKILHVDRGHRLSLQFHELKDESNYLLSGRMLLIKGPSAEELAQLEIVPGHTWRNRPGEVHTIEALEDSDVLEVSTPQLDDVVRLTDNYGREGTSQP
jgi:mannose-6-phosphate isomerase